MVRLRIEDLSALRGAFQELPFVRNADFVVFGGQLAREGIKRSRELQDSHRALVDFRMPAAAPNHGLQELAVGTNGHFDHRGARKLLAARGVGEIDRAYPLDLAAPAVQVNGNVGFPRVRGYPKLLPGIAA